MLERWTGAAAAGDGEPDRPPGPLDRWKLPLTAVLLAIAAIGMAVALARAPARQPVSLPTPAAGAGARPLKVHVAGAVARPGLYTLAEGDRVADALDRAGGSVPGADLGRINLAQPLKDGQQVLVPAVPRPAEPAVPGAADPAADASRSGVALLAPGTAGAPAPPTTRRPTRPPTPHPGARVNLNRATAAELESLPGIGPVTAAKILEHRESRGAFTTAEDLRRERLVSNSVWERVKDLIEAPQIETP